MIISDEQNSTYFNIDDLDKYSGIRIKNSANECFLKRRNDDNNTYWVKCRLIRGKIKELEPYTEEQLLNILNSDKHNFVLINS